MTRHRFAALIAMLALVVPGAAVATAAQSLQNPEGFFGFPIGQDETLARWDRVVEYLDLVGRESDRVRVDHVGETTLGNPFLAVVISAPDNLAQIDEYRAAARRLTTGAGTSEAEAEQLAADGKVIVFITHNIHSTEIGASQTSIELVHELASGTDAGTLEILANVILVLVPSANPDGQIMVTDWYRDNLGTDFEEAPMPWLYHHYAGHDNNRDFFMGNLVETRHMFRLLFQEWTPQIYLDQHQMGSTGPRIFVPPYPDPQSPDIPPLMFQQLRMLGGAIVTDLQAAGKQGVLTGVMYRIYGQEGALSTRFHNMIGVLTETASARVASPVEVSMEELQRSARRRQSAEYGFSVSMVDPWPGGTWRLRDIVDYQLIAARATLKQAARYRREFLYNHYLMAREAVARADIEGPYAWLVSPEQADPVTAADLVQRLVWQGVQVHQAQEEFEAVPAPGRDPWAAEDDSEDGDSELDNEEDSEEDESEDDDSEDDDSDEDSGDDSGDEDHDDAREIQPRRFPAGTFVIPGAQASRAALIDLLEVRSPEVRREYPGGPFRRRYDSTAYTMPLLMGVEVVRVDSEFDASIVPVTEARLPVTVPDGDANAYALDPRINASYEMANRLLAAGVAVHRTGGMVRAGGEDLPPGTFIVPTTAAATAARVRRIAGELDVPLARNPRGGPATPIRAARLGVYKPWTASMDEGWTRFVLEEYGFPYASLDNASVRAGDLGASYDVIIIPAQIPLTALLEGRDAEEMPEPYAGGIGEEGVAALRRFVQGGGTLLTFERSDAVVLEHFEVPVRDALAAAPRGELFVPPSLVRIEVDTSHPFGLGMPEQAAARLASGRAYEPDGWDAAAGNIRVVARYPAEGRVLASGALVGDEHMAGRAAIVEIGYGEGRIVMYGFRVQHRGQTHGTYKLLFNALYR